MSKLTNQEESSILEELKNINSTLQTIIKENTINNIRITTLECTQKTLLEETEATRFITKNPKLFTLITIGFLVTLVLGVATGLLAIIKQFS